ncbi:uncharacterized protein RHO25_010750 [Cercospora beticola]|uniref:Uncharacterized protein n=1 Tax=Cercospora beticola TaxID=122368 RepID=A0ABZ0P2L9_CERBT|nr:hypothetical protein RHO25_010750 [Cercospora beticola]CAK1365975.1 unnamed protein product [Cercospora beticola]
MNSANSQIPSVVLVLKIARTADAQYSSIVVENPQNNPLSAMTNRPAAKDSKHVEEKMKRKAEYLEREAKRQQQEAEDAAQSKDDGGEEAAAEEENATHV